MIEASSAHELAINPIIHAELATAYRTPATLERALFPPNLIRLPLPYEAGWIAAHTFLSYRERDGQKRSPRPDFYIRARAQVEEHVLLSRDENRYRAYFPSVALICPELHPFCKKRLIF